MGKWMPLEDGFVILDREINGLRGYDVELQKRGSVMVVGDMNANMRYVVRLKDNERLCRLVPDEGSVPSDLLRTIGMALRDSREYTDSINGLDDDYKAKWRTKINAALAWFESQKGGK